MENKNKILVILMFLLVIFIMAQVLGSVSAANGKKVVDKGIGPHKDYKSIKINWTTTVYKDNKLEVYRSFSKNDTIYKVKKTIFKRVSKNKLKVFTVEKYNKNITKSHKYIKIKDGLTLKSYYFNIYQPKLLKKMVTSKSFDSGSGYLSNIPHGSIKWNARVYYNNKVLIKEDVDGISGYVKKTFIERNGKGKLKITTKYNYDIKAYDPKTKKYVGEYKKITYIKSNLSPKNYYLKVYKPKMIKYLSDKYFGCIDVVPTIIPPETVIYKEVANGNLANSSGKMEWTINKYYNGKIVVVRNYTDNSFLNSTTVIEQFNKTTLKILTAYNCDNKSSNWTYVNYSLDPYTYFLTIYRPEMLKLIKGNITIIKNESYLVAIRKDNYILNC